MYRDHTTPAYITDAHGTRWDRIGPWQYQYVWYRDIGWHWVPLTVRRVVEVADLCELTRYQPVYGPDGAPVTPHPDDARPHGLFRGASGTVWADLDGEGWMLTGTAGHPQEPTSLCDWGRPMAEDGPTTYLGPHPHGTPVPGSAGTAWSTPDARLWWVHADGLLADNDRTGQPGYYTPELVAAVWGVMDREHLEDAARPRLRLAA